MAEIIRITAEIEEFGKNNNESVIVELLEKYGYCSIVAVLFLFSFSFPYIFYREQIKVVNEMNIKNQQYRNKIENTKAQRVELVNNIQSLEIQLLNKKNDLNSVRENSQMQIIAMERYNIKLNIYL